MNRGVTLIELITVIALLVIVAGITLASFSNLNKTNALEADVANVVSLLSDARSKTLASEGDQQYGVHIDADEVVQFVGSAYTAGSASNETFSLNNEVEVTNISLVGGGTDVVFERLTGKTSQSGTFVVRLKDASTASTTITVYETGIIETN